MPDLSITPDVTIQRVALTAAEVAARFQVTEKSVRRWALAGLVPSYRVGSRVRFDLAAVEAALQVPASQGRQ